jgi:two-component system NarL family sensor kinase
MTRAAILAYGLLAVGLTEAAVAVAGAVVADMSLSRAVDSYLVTNTAMGVTVLLCGALIARHRPGNPIGWLFLGFGLAHLTSAALTPLQDYGAAHGWPVPALRALVTVSLLAWPFGIGMLLPLALALFPDGASVSRRWRSLRWLTIAAGAGFVAWMGVADAWLILDGTRIESYLALDAPGALVLANPALLAVYLVVIASLVVRYRRGDDRTRRQLLWLLLAVIAIIVVNWQRWVLADLSEEGILLLLTVPLIPVAVVIAILRHQLFDIRLVVSRTVLYAALTGAVVGSYAVLVALLDGVLRGFGAPVLATVLIALAFNPVRVWLQRGVDRAFYGARRDPVLAVSTVGDRLAGEDLAGVLGGVREALRLPFAALRIYPQKTASWTGRHEAVPQIGPQGTSPDAESESDQQSGSREVAASGTPPAALCAVPLSYHGERVGELVVGVRPGQSRLSGADLTVLDLLATPLAVALHATALSEALQASRERLVTAAEEERRRLHRELHDSLGPTLTGAAFSADAIGNLAATDPDRARVLSTELRAQLTAAIGDVRRMVYGLRPPALDELGLVGALRRYAGQLDGGLRVTVTADERLPVLPAAVEVAAYRIATEALTNVVRHAAARSAAVSVAASGAALRLRVDDDGRAVNGDGPPDRDGWRPGVGLRSIAERAAELGGACEAGPTPTGGRVSAVLPLGSES